MPTCGHLWTGGPTPPKDRSRPACGRNPAGAALIAAAPTITAGTVAADAFAAGPTAAASPAVAAAREDVPHEAGNRAGQGHALHDEGDVEAHQATLPVPELRWFTVISLRLLPATSP